MKLIELVRVNFSFLGIIPYNKCPFNKKNMTMLSMLGMGSFLNCVHLLHEATTFKEYADSVCACTSMVMVTIGFSIFIWETHPIFSCMNNAEAIFTKRSECQQSKNNHERISENVRKINEFIDIFIVKFVFPCVMFSKFITSYIVYFTTDLGNESFELPFPYWFPFDRQSPIGFLIAFLLQSMICLHLFIFLSRIFSCGVGCYFILDFLIDDLENDLKSIADSTESQEKCHELEQKFSDIIQFQSTVKKTVREMSEIAQPFFMLAFVSSIIVSCGGLLLIRMQISIGASNFMILIVPIFELLSALVAVFVPCELAGRVARRFEGIDHTIKQFKWYLFPLKLRKILPIIFINAQEPVCFACFGSIPSDRETFKKVVNCGFSYFMMLREF